MTGAQLTFLCTIWDQIALFQLAVSLHYVFNPVKQLYHVHGNPGFALHQLQQIYNGILDGEIRKWFFSDLPRARFIRATQGSLLCSNAAKKHCGPPWFDSQWVSCVNNLDFCLPLFHLDLFPNAAFPKIRRKKKKKKSQNYNLSSLSGLNLSSSRVLTASDARLSRILWLFILNCWERGKKKKVVCSDSQARPFN